MATLPMYVKGAHVVLGHDLFIMGSVMLLERRIPRSVGKVPLERGK